MLFSSRLRVQYLQQLQREVVDLLVIGGGITGAGIALDAQTRGMSVGLIDMQDFSAGTSSRSTKLVHGGLRYLKQLEVKMVADVGRERAIVYENGPHVTTPEWMLLPIHKGGTFGRSTTSFGLLVYDFLAGVKKEERRKMLSAEETIAKEPLLKREGLLGGGYYVEYRTDDARLTIEVLKKAVEHGALAVNYAKVTELLYVGHTVVGARVVDQLSGETYTIRAKKVVNATGPWVDSIRELDRSKKGKMLHLTKGVHLVFDQSRFPLQQAIYFDAPDGRMVFAIPRDQKTYVGTTDTDYHSDPKHPRVMRSDREYLLRALNNMFPELQLTNADIESSWAGVRPLIHEQGKSPSEISRHDEIFVSPSGLISIAGGKLTGYRKMAESIVDLVARDLRGSGLGHFTKSKTKHLPISGGEVGGSAGFQTFIESKAKEGTKYSLSQQASKKLAARYGSNVGQIFTFIQELQQKEVEPTHVEVLACLEYAIEYEMATTPLDFFIRRTGGLYFMLDWVQEYKQVVLEYMSDRLSWSEEQKSNYLKELEQEIYYATHSVDEHAQP